ncbi:ABC transporter permease [Patescibacteria group bacterium]|nr:ABC transporter permease [Patescibacteria group bacterium]MBU1613094.1 ABC transporter permease [Patescibacteria group bacterium]
MNLSTTIKLSVDTLRRQKLRSVLTILGIAVGISIVIAIMAAGRGLDYLIIGELDAFGPNTISIEVKVPSVKKTSNENAIGQAQGITITTLKEKDLDDISKHPNIEGAYGWLMGQEIVSYGGLTKKVLLAGEGYQMMDVEKFEISEGRMYTKEDEDSLSQVVVLGTGVKEKFFGDDTAVGKIVRIKGKPFRVIGTAAKRGVVFFMNMDDMVYLPVKTLQKRILGIDYFSAVVAKMKDKSLSAETVEELNELIRENHNITDPNKDDFAINTMEEAAQMLGTVVGGITFLLVALVCISLLVGGVGIMNIMYVSVAERTFEIGLRKSLGARKSDIMWQFLSEAIIVTITGGIVGVVLGAVLTLIIYLAATYYNLSWIYSIPLSSILLSITFSAVIGLVFGLYPARKAANLNPIEALRRE